MWILAEPRRIIPADLQVDGPVLVVQGPHREAPVRGRVDGGVPALERVLLRRETEPPQHRPLHLANCVPAGQAAQRVRLIDQLQRAQGADVEVPPPGRLGLPPVPVEQVRQQGLRLLLTGPLRAPSMSKNRSPEAGSGSASRPRLIRRAPATSRSGSRISYRMRPVSSLATCRRACRRAPSRDGRSLRYRREERPGMPARAWPAPRRLQRPPLVPGDPGDERQVVVAAPAVFAEVVPAADHAVLHRLRVGIFRRSRSRDG